MNNTKLEDTLESILKQSKDVLNEGHRLLPYPHSAVRYDSLPDEVKAWLPKAEKALADLVKVDKENSKVQVLRNYLTLLCPARY